MTYNIYTTQSHGVINHVAIFIETEVDGSGLLYHVTGTVLRGQGGMTYEKRKNPNPEEVLDYVDGSKIRFGTIEAVEIPTFEAICEVTPPPGPQITLGGKRLDVSRPVRRCGEWVEEVKAKALEDGIVRAAC